MTPENAIDGFPETLLSLLQTTTQVLTVFGYLGVLLGAGTALTMKILGKPNVRPGLFPTVVGLALVSLQPLTQWMLAQTGVDIGSSHGPAVIVPPLIVTTFVFILSFLPVRHRDRSASAAEFEVIAVESEDVEPVADNKTLLDRLIARHDAVLDEWRKYTAEDIDLVLRHPALSDVTETFVVDLQRALEDARDLRIDPDTCTGSESIMDSPYRRAVGDLERAWSRALKESTRISSSHLSKDERRLLAQAEQIFAIVRDETTLRAERATAAKRLDGILRRLSLVSEERTPLIIRELETARAGELMPAHSTTRTKPTSASTATKWVKQS